MQRFILRPWDCVSTPSPGTVLLQSQPSCLWSNYGAENKVNNSTWTWTCRCHKLQKLHSNRKFSIKQSTYQVQVGYSLPEIAGSSPTLQRGCFCSATYKERLGFVASTPVCQLLMRFENCHQCSSKEQKQFQEIWLPFNPLKPEI